MLYEFAMTPELFDASVANADKAAGIILQQLLRGISENGLLASPHGGRWLDHIAKERIVSLPPPLKDKILTLLKILGDRHRLVSHPISPGGGDPPSDPAWLDLLLDGHRRVPYHAIILSQMLMGSCGRQCDGFVEFFTALDSPQWSSSQRRTLSLRKSLTDYSKALVPVLRYAKSLWLVDPYLNPYQHKFVDVVEVCSKLMGQGSYTGSGSRIHIHANYQKLEPNGCRAASDHMDEWEKQLSPLIKADGHHFKVFLWDSGHDRFILTDQCGISVPGGLDCYAHNRANSTDWNLLDEHARIHRLAYYDPASSPFRLVDKREIP